MPILQHDAELAWVVDLYRRQRPRSVLEIGVWHGGTLFHWLTQARRDVSVVVVGVDPEIVDERLFRSWAPDNVDLRFVVGRSGNPVTVRSVMSLLPRYDWVFIDGDHHYDCVNADWLAYASVKQTVVFHDVFSQVNHDQQVPLFWNDLKAAGWKTEEFSSDAGAAAGWGGIGVVYPGR